MRVTKISRNIALFSIVLLTSCISIANSPLRGFNSNVDLDKLYEDFKLKNKKEFEEKMKLKKTDNFENINMYINTGLQKSNSNTFGIKSIDLKNIIRKKTWIAGNHTTNATHKNDQNIFDVNKSIESLGLTPYEGDIQEDNNPMRKSSIKINDQGVVNVYSELVNIEFKDDSKISEFKNLYGAEIIGSYKGMNLIKFDINKANVSNLENLIKEYNKTIPESIENIEFSSISSMKTLTIILDIFLNHKDLYKSMFFENIVPVNTVKADYYPSDFDGNGTEIKFDNNKESSTYGKYIDSMLDPEQSPDHGKITGGWFIPSYIPITGHGKSWWLQETKIVNLWKYSIGTGVNIAHIDQQPFGLNQNINNKKFDIDSRRLILNVNNKKTGFWGFLGKDVFSNDSNENHHHGYGSIMT